VSVPSVKDVEARHQTHQKLEAIDRYFGAWCSILAQARRYSFCPTRLWLIDTHAGTGLHLSEADPDGQVPGSPLLAVLAARAAQQTFPEIEVRVRATDRKKSVAAKLEAAVARFRGSPPGGVDVTVRPVDWIEEIGPLKAEIAQEDHVHGGRPGRGSGHDHRRVWFVDPFGIESLHHAAIEQFPVGSEVIINLDLMGAKRHLGKARTGDADSARHLDIAFGGDAWRRVPEDERTSDGLAEAFAGSFGTSKWRIARWHLLRATGSQDRALVQLTNQEIAAQTFARSVRDALRAGTVVAGRTLTMIQKDTAAKRLAAQLAGLTIGIDEMALAGTHDRGQLRAICSRADEQGYGGWDAKSGTMRWYLERQSNPTIWGLSDAGEDLG
jgi:three-Cys-motif partner protein